MIDATIAVITYKRPQWLYRLLTSLVQQVFSNSKVVDILIVDNACEHQIESIVASFTSKSPFKIHYVAEKTPGIVAARNKAVEFFLNSGSANLFFIDDDEWPQSTDWAQVMLDQKVFFTADIVTSCVISVGEKGTPQWAVDLIYGRNPHNKGDLLKVFYTNNLLISRRVLEKIKPAFDSRFAMTGASDYHFALKCYRNGFKAVYVDAPVIEEFPKSRATLKWFMRRGLRSGIGFTRSHLYEETFAMATLRCSAFSVFRFLRGLYSLLSGSISFNKLKIVDGIFRICSSIGTIVGFFGVKYNEYNKIHGK